MRSAAFAAILLAVSGSACAAEELRTLFHTANERDQLDRLRRGEPAVAAPAAAAAARAAPAVSGFVKRSDGRSTVWLDGRPVTGPEAHRLADPAKLREPPRDASPPIEITRSR